MGRELIELDCGCVIDPCACGDTYHKDYRSLCAEARQLLDNVEYGDPTGAAFSGNWDAYVQHYREHW